MVAAPVKPESVSTLRLKPESKYAQELLVCLYGRVFFFSDGFVDRPTTTEMTKAIGELLKEKLENLVYQSDRASAMAKELADAIKAKLRGEGRW
jgi:hypothetical protein